MGWDIDKSHESDDLEGEGSPNSELCGQWVFLI